MALDFTKDISNVTRQIEGYLKRNLPVPKCTLEHYNTLIGSVTNSIALEESGGTSPTSLSSSFPTVTTTNSIVLATSSTRTYFIIQNIGDETVYINFGAPATIGGGLKLLASAEFSTEITQFTQTAINAIAEANISTLAIYEVA